MRVRFENMVPFASLNLASKQVPKNSFGTNYPNYQVALFSFIFGVESLRPMVML